MRRALILAGALATIANPALAVDPAKVPVLEAQMRADEQVATQAADKAEAAAKIVLQTKDRHEAFYFADKVLDQTFIAEEASDAWRDQCLAAYGPVDKCKALHNAVSDELFRAGRANYKAHAYAESLPLD
jgi:hypothetical protein